MVKGPTCAWPTAEDVIIAQEQAEKGTTFDDVLADMGAMGDDAPPDAAASRRKRQLGLADGSRRGHSNPIFNRPGGGGGGVGVGTLRARLAAGGREGEPPPPASSAKQEDQDGDVDYHEFL